jgi:hypothetical protein
MLASATQRPHMLAPPGKPLIEHLADQIPFSHSAGRHRVFRAMRDATSRALATALKAPLTSAGHAASRTKQFELEEPMTAHLLIAAADLLIVAMVIRLWDIGQPYPKQGRADAATANGIVGP